MIWGHIPSFENLFQMYALSMMSTPASVDKLTEVTMKGVFYKMLETHRHHQPGPTLEGTLQGDLYSEHSLTQHLSPCSSQATQTFRCHQPFPIHPASQKRQGRVPGCGESVSVPPDRGWKMWVSGVPFPVCGSPPICLIRR